MKFRHKPQPGEFRLIKAFTIDHNIKRLRKHVAKIKRSLRNDRFMQIMRLKGLRTRQASSSAGIKS